MKSYVHRFVLGVFAAASPVYGLVYAQGAGPGTATPPPPPAPTVEYTLRLTQQEVNQIGNALFVRPYNEVAQVIQKLTQQVQEQDAKRAPTAGAPPPAPAPSEHK